jgi:surface polysaccharide O-acyltransferase-like enzyme
MSVDAVTPQATPAAADAAPTTGVDPGLAEESRSLAAGVGGVFAPQPTDATPLHKPRRMHYGDAIRILGTVAVVVGHVADMRLFSSHVLDRDWWVCNAWDALTRWAVPAYIMLSGALLLDPARNEAPSHFYRKRLARLGAPIVFWTAFFMWFGVEYTGWINRDGRPSWAEAVKLLVLGKPYTHLHFMFRIAGLYFFTPMLRTWLRHSTRQMQWAATLMALILAAGDNTANAITSNELTVFMRFVPFIGYYLLGYLLRDTLVSRRGFVWCWIGFVASYLVLMLGTGLTVKWFHQPGTWLKGPPSMEMLQYDFLSPVRIVMAVCAWLIFVKAFHKPWPQHEGSRKLVGEWAATTLGLYLIHPMFREILYLGQLKVPWIHGWKVLWHHQPGFGPEYPNIWVGIPLAVVMIYTLSLAATIVIMRIPYVRRIAG